MRRRLILLRHGHAAEAADDYSRPLSDVGRVQAREAGLRLQREGWLPAKVLSSSAPRALVTAQSAAQALGYRAEIETDKGLYLAGESRLLSALRRVDPRFESVLLVGHNPGLSALARELCASRSELSTGEYALLELELDTWSELG